MFKANNKKSKFITYIIITILLCGIFIPINSIVVSASLTKSNLVMVCYTTHDDLLNPDNSVEQSIIDASPEILIDNTEHSYWGTGGPQDGSNNCVPSLYPDTDVYGYLYCNYELYDLATLLNSCTEVATDTGVKGIFLDCVSSDPDTAQQSYLTSVWSRVHTVLGLKLIINTGVDSFDYAFLRTVSDYIMTNEQYTGTPPTSDEIGYGLSKVIVINNNVNISNATSYSNTAINTYYYQYTWMTDYEDYGSLEDSPSSYLSDYASLFGPVVTTTTTGSGTYQENPDAISISSCYVYNNIYETGDWVIVFEYNIGYTTTPIPTNTTISNLFNSYLLDTDHTTILNTKIVQGVTYTGRPINFLNWSMSGIYFTAAEVASFHLDWEAAYDLQIKGNPTYYDPIVEGTNQVTYSLASSTHWFDNTMTDNRNNLASYLMNSLVPDLQVKNVGVTYITTASGSICLNLAGRTLVTTALPYLDTPIPSIFSLAIQDIVVTQPVATGALQSDLTINKTLGSTVSTAFTNFGHLINISGQATAAGWIFLMILILVSVIFLSTGNITAALVIAAVPMLLVGTWIGAIPVAFLFTGVILIVVGFVFFGIIRSIF